MKLRLLVISLALLTQVLFAQNGKQRILVSPYGDVIPIEKGQSVKSAQDVHARMVASSAGCSGVGYFGFNPAQYPITTGTYGLHKDVIGSWFTVPATGVIDTIFWYGQTDICAADSLLFVRIHESNIFEGHGPGYDGFPKPSSSTCWGYLPNTNDLENGIAAFPDDATDTTWISTVTSGPGNSYRPFGNEIWGLGGLPVKTRAGQTNYLSTNELFFQPNVTIGDHIMITFRINGDSTETCKIGGPYTGFAAYSGNPDTIPDELTHNWKFYEKTPNLPGFTCKGWVARGDFHLMIWYAMTVSTNLPPNIIDVTPLGNTLSTTARTIDAEIEDCDPSNPDSAGITTALVEYSVDDVPQTPLVMVNIGGNIFEAEIPGFPGGTKVTYNIRAFDMKGMETFNSPSSYNIVRMRTTLGEIDTTEACTFTSIRSSGTAIPHSEFFLPPTTTATNTNPMDDGTAGPFPLGAPFFVGSKPYNYAWIGVNGAISLSENATDTTDVNANGFYSANWTFPYPIHKGRSDTLNSSDMPITFIAPFWNDMIVGDSAISYGNIYYKDEGDKFIVEWDSLGRFTTTNVFQDEMIFRVVLNKTDNTITFQYDNVGSTGLDTSALVGIQADSLSTIGSAPWLFINQNNAPVELTPRNYFCTKFYNAISFPIRSGWNLVSLPVVPVNGDSLKTTTFPTATTQAFAYTGAYSPQVYLTPGVGYWAKFNGVQEGSVIGTPFRTLNIPANAGWNLIGALSVPLSVSSITSPIVSGSNFYAYGNGYTIATTLSPGKGYWVKTNSSGVIILDATVTEAKRTSSNIVDLSAMQSFRITDANGGNQTLYIGSEQSLKAPASKFDLPPAPPKGLFDARFTTQRMAETYPVDVTSDKAIEYTIQIQSEAYPVTVSWNSFFSSGATITLTDKQNGKLIGNTIVNGTGKIVVKDPAVTSLLVRVTEGSTKPTEFALSQNYPNPFNPSTRFSVEIPQLTDVDVAVFDVLGRKIATLLNGEKQAGFYTIEWNGTDNQGFAVPTGIYLVRMNASDYSMTRKVMLMK